MSVERKDTHRTNGLGRRWVSGFAPEASGWLAVGLLAPLAAAIGCAAPTYGAEAIELGDLVAEQPTFTCHDPVVVAHEPPTEDLASPTRPPSDSTVAAIRGFLAQREVPRLSLFGPRVVHPRLARIAVVDREGRRHVATFLRPSSTRESAPALLRVDHLDERRFTMLVDRSGETLPLSRSSLDALTNEAVGRASASMQHLDGLEFPPQMPPIRFPQWHSCTATEERQAARAWALAHHHAWRAQQLFTYLDANPTQREELWSHHFDAADGELDQWSPRAWFGVYRGADYTAIRGVVNDIYHRMMNAEIGSIEVDFKCTPTSAGNICNTVGPDAHHAMIGWVNGCNEFFQDWDDLGRAHVLLHEMVHHAWVTWYEHPGMVVDNHSHHHGAGCGDGGREYMVGFDLTRHLADSEDCNDRMIRIHNVDSYARMMSTFGRAVFEQRIAFYPTFGEGGTPPAQSCGAGNPDNPPATTDTPCVKIGQQMYCWGNADGGLDVAGDNCILSEPITPD
jgi:hypothetical protein